MRTILATLTFSLFFAAMHLITGEIIASPGPINTEAALNARLDSLLSSALPNRGSQETYVGNEFMWGKLMGTSDKAQTFISSPSGVHFRDGIYVLRDSYGVRVGGANIGWYSCSEIEAISSGSEQVSVSIFLRNHMQAAVDACAS